MGVDRVFGGGEARRSSCTRGWSGIVPGVVYRPSTDWEEYGIGDKGGLRFELAVDGVAVEGARI